MRDEPRHIPVLETTVLEVLSPAPGETVLDVTLGLGGHALRMLDAVGPTGRLIGLDADTKNLQLAQQRLEGRGVSELHHANFRDLPALKLPPVDVLLADLGLSSPHVDDPTRGFTFRTDAPLDLRFDQSTGETATELMERSSAEELFEIFRTYGEFPGGARLGRALAGKNTPTTFALKQIVENTFGFQAKSVLPQVFQALRIAVNDELGALDILLEVGPKLLCDGGRMGVISYHSLEDRAVKQTFRTLTSQEKDPITGKALGPATFELLTRRPLVPSQDEITQNPRARSAKFRVIRRQHS